MARYLVTLVYQDFVTADSKEEAENEFYDRVADGGAGFAHLEAEPVSAGARKVK